MKPQKLQNALCAIGYHRPEEVCERKVDINSQMLVHAHHCPNCGTVVREESEPAPEAMLDILLSGTPKKRLLN